MIAITLPWPSPVLSPNSRTHWAVKSRAVKSARVAAFYQVRAASKATVDWPRADVRMTFCPPDKRRRDMDNMVASMKAAADGIADAIGIDDSKFTATYALSEPVKGGLVRVVIQPARAA